RGGQGHDWPAQSARRLGSSIRTNEAARGVSPAVDLHEPELGQATECADTQAEHRDRLRDRDAGLQPVQAVHPLGQAGATLFREGQAETAHDETPRMTGERGADTADGDPLLESRLQAESSGATRCLTNVVDNFKKISSTTGSSG